MKNARWNNVVRLALKRCLASVFLAPVLLLGTAPSPLWAECGPCYGTTTWGIRYYYDCVTGEVCYTCPAYDPGCAPPPSGTTAGGTGTTGTGSTSSPYIISVSVGSFPADGSPHAMTVTVRDRSTGNPASGVHVGMKADSYTYMDTTAITDSFGAAHPQVGTVVPGTETVTATVPNYFGSASVGSGSGTASVMAQTDYVNWSSPAAGSVYRCYLPKNDPILLGWSRNSFRASPYGYSVSVTGDPNSSFSVSRDYDSGFGSDSATSSACNWQVSYTTSHYAYAQLYVKYVSNGTINYWPSAHKNSASFWVKGGV